MQTQGMTYDTAIRLCPYEMLTTVQKVPNHYAGVHASEFGDYHLVTEWRAEDDDGEVSFVRARLYQGGEYKKCGAVVGGDVVESYLVKGSHLLPCTPDQYAHGWEV